MTGSAAETILPSNQAICVTGPEATGKSSLSEALSAALGIPLVPEFAREYLGSIDRPYREDDLDEILKGQIRLENEARGSSQQTVVCDTGPEVVWVWSFYKYGRVSPFIDETTRGRSYNATLLLDIDLPWTPDPLRENPDYRERQELLSIYGKLLADIGRPFQLVRGIEEDRFENSLMAIRKLIANYS